jgi:hypothetical protein
MFPGDRVGPDRRVQSAHASLSDFARHENERVGRMLAVLAHKERGDLEALGLGGRQDGSGQTEEEYLRQRREKLYEALHRETHPTSGDSTETATAPEEPGPRRGVHRALQRSLSASVEYVDLFGDQLAAIADEQVQSAGSGLVQLPPTRRSNLATSMNARLDALRADSSKAEELELRVREFQREHRRRIEANDDHVKANILATSAEVKELQQREAAEKFAKAQALRESVLRRADILFEEDHQKKIATANKMEIKKARLLAEAEERARVLERQTLQKKWMQVVNFAARQQLWLEAALSLRVVRAVWLRESSAASTIQRFWRVRRGMVVGREWRRKMWVVTIMLRRWVRRWRKERERKAADTIYHFLGDIQDVTNIVSVIKRFRFQVRQSQTHWRLFDGVHTARMTVLRVQFDQVQQKLLRAAKDAIQDARREDELLFNALTYTSQAMKKRKETLGQKTTAGNAQKGRNLMKMVQAERVRGGPTRQQSRSGLTAMLNAANDSGPTLELLETTVSVKARDQLLFENLRERERERARVVAAHVAAVEKWEQQERENSALEHARMILQDTASAPGSMASILTRKASVSMQSRQQRPRPQANNHAVAAQKAAAAQRLKRPKRPKPIPPFHVLMHEDEMAKLVRKALDLTIEYGYEDDDDESKVSEEDPGAESDDSMDSQTSDLAELEHSLRVQARGTSQQRNRSNLL